MSDDQDFAELLKTHRNRFGWSQTALAERIGVHRNTISKLETRDKIPDKPEVLQLAREFQLEGEEWKKFLIAAGLKGNTPREILWNIPYRRNPFFTGHNDIFPLLWEKLAPGRGTKATALTQAISGLGGIGKTQVAVEYAYRYANEYDAVLWLPADSTETLVAACLQLSMTELKLPEQQEANRQVGAVKSWLQTHQKWLLILDNVEKNQEIFSILVPNKHQGSVLITTRMQHVGSLARIVELSLLPMDDAVLFLLRRAGRIALEVSIDTALPHDILSATNLCALMNRLPLALDQAGAYIAENGCSLEQYIDLYRQCRQVLLDRRGAKDLEQITDHPDSVLMTFWLSWEQIQGRNALAGKALQFCAFLGPDQIPEQLVLNGIMPSAETENISDTFEIDEALGLLHRYSLVERAEQTLSLHRLVQEVMQEVLSEEERQQWMERAVLAAEKTFPDSELEHWQTCEQLMPHVFLCVNWIEQRSLINIEGVYLLYRAGFYLLSRGQYSNAERLCKTALKAIEELVTEENSFLTALCLNTLGCIYIGQEKYKEAEESLQKASIIHKEHQGENGWSEVQKISSNLALSYKEQGKYDEAEQLYKQVLNISEEQLGKEHSHTAQIVNNLAELYRAQGKFNETKSLLQKALTIRLKQSGENHPDTAESLNNLAGLYRQQGMYDKARPLYQRALLIRVKLLGEKHPLTAQSLNNLADVSLAQKKYDEAEQFYQRGLAVCEDLIKKGSPVPEQIFSGLVTLYQEQEKYTEEESLYKRILSIYEGISDDIGIDHALAASARLYFLQGRYHEMVPLYQRRLALVEQKHGSDNSLICQALSDLADLYFQLGWYTKAEPLYQRALYIYEQVMGSDDLDVAMLLIALATLYREQGRIKEVEPLCQRALRIYEQHASEQKLAPDHTVLIASLTELEALYMQQGRYAEALPFGQRLLDISERVLASTDAALVQQIQNLALLYVLLNEYEEGALLYQRALRIYEQIEGSDHPDTASILYNLATLYLRQRNYGKAEALYQQAQKIWEQAFGPRHIYVGDVLHDLANLYSTQGREREAKACYQQALAIREQTLGKTHQRTEETRERYATLLQKMGHSEEAARIRKQVDAL